MHTKTGRRVKKIKTEIQRENNIKRQRKTQKDKKNKLRERKTEENIERHWEAKQN